MTAAHTCQDGNGNQSSATLRHVTTRFRHGGFLVDLSTIPEATSMPTQNNVEVLRSYFNNGARPDGFL
jgi:hypothetical protein